MRLIPGPYIFSSRSKSVVSRVGGGRSTACEPAFRGSLGAALTDSSGSAAISGSPSSSLEPDASSSGLALSAGASATFSEGLFDCDVFGAAGFFSFGLSDDVPDLDFFLSCLSSEMIVGGSCMGSPARINFCALNIGTQQTCRRYISMPWIKQNVEGYHTASNAWVASSMMTTSKFWFQSCLPPEEWHVARTTCASFKTLRTTPPSRWRYL